MVIKKYKLTTSGRCNMTSSNFTEITTPTPEKSLSQLLENNAGRNSGGRIMVCHQDDGHKRQHRVIGFRRNKNNVVVAVKTIEYNSSRPTNIALAHYEDGVKTYILASKGLEVDMRLVSGPEAGVKVGNALPLGNIPVDTVIHNIEMKPGKGGQLVYSVGASVQVLGKEGKYVLIRLDSGEVRVILATCRATIGSVGNEQRGLVNIGKADRSRWMRKRPTVRDNVINSNDHPHGSGEGKAPIGRRTSVSPWGQPATEYKTHNKKAKSDKLIVRRRTK